MNKYIDAEQLKAEIDKRYAEYRAKMKTDDFTYYEGMADALDHFEQYIDSLQQEQLGAPLHGRVCSDGGHVPGLIVDSAQFHDHLKGFPDNTDVYIFIIAKEDK